MSLPDRTSSLVNRILTARKMRAERAQAMRERASTGHARAKEMMEATAAHWERRRKELHDRLRQIEESRSAQVQRLSALSTQLRAQSPPASRHSLAHTPSASPAVAPKAEKPDAPHATPSSSSVAARRTEVPHAKRAHDSTRRKGGGAK